MTVYRPSLGGAPMDYSEVDFLTPVEQMLPYRIIDGHIARHHTKGPHPGAQYPHNVSVRS
jgi:hypothetical protein